MSTPECSTCLGGGRLAVPIGEYVPCPACKEEARHPAGASTTTPPEGATPPSGPGPCPATGYGWTCARPAGHDGPHVHCGLADASTCARWVEGAETAPPPDDEPLLAEVLRVCEAIGYGRVMQAVSDRWREIDPRGAFACGPCYGSLPEGVATPLDLLEAYESATARLADAELRVALWSGAPVEGWERGGGGRYVRSRGVLAVYLTFPVNEGDPWGWEATCRGRTVADGSDLDPLVCLRAAEAWLSEVPRG